MTSSSRHYYVIMKLLYVITSFLFATCVAETWHELNGVEYFIYRGQKQNFSSAESFCEEKNASLVLIKSKQIQDFLAEKIGNSTDRPHSFYIGLLRINGTKHGFQWIDGTPLTFTQWRNREPNNKLQMEDCVQMGRRGRLDATYSWNDMPCHSNTKVICQRPTKEKVTTSSVIVTSATTVTTQVSLDEKLIKSSTVKDGTVLPNTSDTETLTNFPTTSNPTTLYGTLVKMSTVENTPPQTDHTSSFYTVEFNPTSSEPLPTSTIDGKIETVKLTTQQMLRSSTKTQTIPASTTVGTTRKLIENQHTDETSDPSTQKNPATTPYISLHHEKHTTTPQQSESTTTEASTHITEPATTASVSLDKTRDKQTESPTTFRTTIPASTTVVPDTTQVTTSFYTLSMRATKSHTTPTIGILDTQDDTTLSPTTTTTQTTTTAPHISSGVVGHDISTQTQQAKTTNENIVTTHSATTKQTIVPRPTEIISTSRKVTRRINQEPSTIESLLNTTSAIQQAAQTNKTQATTHMNEDLPNAGARVMVTAIEANNLNIAGAGGSPEQCDCPPYYIIGIVIAILAIIAALVILGIWKRKERKRMQRIDEEREENPRHLYNEQY